MQLGDAGVGGDGEGPVDAVVGHEHAVLLQSLEDGLQFGAVGGDVVVAAEARGGTGEGVASPERLHATTSSPTAKISPNRCILASKVRQQNSIKFRLIMLLTAYLAAVTMDRDG